MKPRTLRTRTMWVLALASAVLTIVPTVARAHCDTLDGPVVAAARIALEKGDVTPVLKWLKPGGEAEVKAAFTKALAVRKLGPEAKDLADMYFFETLVRVHRAGEGAPYTGLKPAGEVDPAVAMADKALESGSVDALVKAISEQAAAGLKERFEKALAAKKHADDSVEAGREFVEAYVEYVHYAEGIHAMAMSRGGHAEGEGESAHGQHEHMHER